MLFPRFALGSVESLEAHSLHIDKSKRVSETVFPFKTKPHSTMNSDSTDTACPLCNGRHGVGQRCSLDNASGRPAKESPVDKPKGKPRLPMKLLEQWLDGTNNPKQSKPKTNRFLTKRYKVAHVLTQKDGYELVQKLGYDWKAILQASSLEEIMCLLRQCNTLEGEPKKVFDNEMRDREMIHLLPDIAAHIVKYNKMKAMKESEVEHMVNTLWDHPDLCFTVNNQSHMWTSAKPFFLKKITVKDLATGQPMTWNPPTRCSFFAERLTFRLEVNCPTNGVDYPLPYIEYCPTLCHDLLLGVGADAADLLKYGKQVSDKLNNNNNTPKEKDTPSASNDETKEPEQQEDTNNAASAANEETKEPEQQENTNNTPSASDKATKELEQPVTTARNPPRHASATTTSSTAQPKPQTRASSKAQSKRRSQSSAAKTKMKPTSDKGKAAASSNRGNSRSKKRKASGTTGKGPKKSNKTNNQHDLFEWDEAEMTEVAPGKLHNWPCPANIQVVVNSPNSIGSIHNKPAPMDHQQQLHDGHALLGPPTSTSKGFNGFFETIRNLATPVHLQDVVACYYHHLLSEIKSARASKSDQVNNILRSMHSFQLKHNVKLGRSFFDDLTNAVGASNQNGGVKNGIDNYWRMHKAHLGCDEEWDAWYDTQFPEDPKGRKK